MPVMTPSPVVKKVLSIQEFRKILETANPLDVEKLPIESLPKVIPEVLVESAYGEMRRVLQSIIFELNMREVGERMKMTDKYNETISDALFYFSDYIGSDNFSIFNRNLKELALLYKTWKVDEDEEKRQELLPKIKELNEIIVHIRTETTSIVQAKQMLEVNFKYADEDRAQFAAEIKNLQYIISRNKKKISQYYHLRLLIVGADMRYLSAKIKDSIGLIALVQQDVNEKNKQLANVAGGKIFSRKGTPDSIDKLRQEINNLLTQKRALEIPIAEIALIAWLDVVVDAELMGDKGSEAIALLGRVRMTLFHLLQRYCEQQEAAARDVAKNPFSQASPEDVIKFLLQSEQFILKYFKKKRIETASWMCDLAGSKVEMLDGIEKHLLKELKKNARLNK